MTALGGQAYVSRLDLARDVGLDQALEHASGRSDAGIVSKIFEAIAAAYHGPIFVVLEVGMGDGEHRGRLHPHVIHHRDDGPAHITRDTERCKKVYDAVGLYRYLHKHEPWSLESELDARAALVLSPSRKLPRMRRHMLGPQRLAWAAERNATVTNDLTLGIDSTSIPDLPLAIAVGPIEAQPGDGDVLPDPRQIEPITDHPQQAHDRAQAHVYQITRAVRAVLRDRRPKQPLDRAHVSGSRDWNAHEFAQNSPRKMPHTPSLTQKRRLRRSKRSPPVYARGKSRRGAVRPRDGPERAPRADTRKFAPRHHSSAHRLSTRPIRGGSR